MSEIINYIDSSLALKEKILSVFLTAGYPSKKDYVDICLSILDAGADFLEVGIPFSDPLADGSVIQASSEKAISNGISIDNVFQFSNSISRRNSKPIIAMGYANPILNYGVESFFIKAADNGISGVIIPDVPLEEYEFFYNQIKTKLDIILLTTPTTSSNRIVDIDNKSSGFVYYVTLKGVTGQSIFIDTNKLKSTRELIRKNHLLAGFGISSPSDVHSILEHVDGVIVGSRIIKEIEDGNTKAIDKTLKLVSDMKFACKVE